MPVLFARVELRGTPTEATYEKLHAHMYNLNWYQNLPGYPKTPMPHAMYQASFDQLPDTSTVASALKQGIEKSVWTRALVLVIRESHWAQTAG
jgi:hypothetical protein